MLNVLYSASYKIRVFKILSEANNSGGRRSYCANVINNNNTIIKKSKQTSLVW